MAEDGNKGKNGHGGPILLLLLVPLLVLCCTFLQPDRADFVRFSVLLLVPAGLDFRQHDHHRCRLLRHRTPLKDERIRHAPEPDGLDRLCFFLRSCDFCGVRRRALEEGRPRSAPRMGSGRREIRHPHHLSSCSAAISIPPTPSLRCQRLPSVPARSRFSRCPTPSWSIPLCSWYSRGCGRWPARMAMSPPPISCAAATATAGWLWPLR